MTSVSPADGQVLWQHKWRGFPIVQPAFTPDGGMLLAVASDSGTRRLAVAPGSSGWTVEERWTSRGLKPYFNDFVVHEGHAYGFDGRILACIDLADGRRSGRAAATATASWCCCPSRTCCSCSRRRASSRSSARRPTRFAEIARVPAIQGKTWNHPVLAGDVLLVRNGEEMAAFRLARASR